ncbi:MAG: hypothetical protein HN617_03660 [Planctomycetaceae bacterium]|nr:hypothetical protein [Planctomycetaceae bacterium]MBT7916620.1 hypothetical protein [Planctomycetaceae bacterium]
MSAVFEGMNGICHGEIVPILSRSHIDAKSGCGEHLRYTDLAVFDLNSSGFI